MTPEEQNIEIAKVVGWKDISKEWAGHDMATMGIRPNYPKYPNPAHFKIPNFHGSLDAMAEAEKVFNPMRVPTGGRYPKESELYGKYIDHLLRTCEQQNSSPCHATAPQRAEAFLRTVGKWKDK